MEFLSLLLRRLTCLAVLALWLPPAVAYGSVILAGTTYLSSNGGYYHFAPDLPPAAFHGVPLGVLGNADSLLRRPEDAVFGGFGTSVRIPIEMVQISAKSDAPILVGDRLFDFAFALTPGIQSTGYMDITLEREDDGTDRANGTYTTHVTLNFSALFTPVDGGPGAFTGEGSIFIESVDPGLWSFNPGAEYCLAEGNVGDVTANLHHDRPAGAGDFFTLGPMPMATRTAPPNGGIHSPCTFGSADEPPTMALFATPLVALIIFARRGSRCRGSVSSRNRSGNATAVEHRG